VDLGLADRVAVVTAGGAGIALAIVEALVAEGVKVVTADLDVSQLAGRDGVQAVEADLLAPGAAEELVKVAIESHGRLDILVNCLGAARPRVDGFGAMTDDDWRWGLDVNLMGMVRVTRAALPHLESAPHGGVIVSIGSDAAREAFPLFMDYGVAKAAVLSLSKALSRAYAPRVRVNVVSPGPTRTASFEGFFAGIAEERGITIDEVEHHFATEVRNIPTGRVGRPAEVAAVVLFLVSDRAAQVTGSEYCVNGGVLHAV
jgi:NAD(P)-dependent dehydrogenase (short-subunit alcohol dehydrogenase family)